MTPRTQRFALATVGILSWTIAASPVEAGGHTWRIKEVFSNASGTVQFIELVETCGTPNETGLIGHQVKANANFVNLTANLPPGTSANKHILFGTANLTSFGGPTPDYIIPANFISLTGVTLEYTPQHTCIVGSGVIPTNGSDSLNRPAGCNLATCPATVATNSPTNLAGQTGTVNAGACMDADSDGYGSPGDAACPNGAETDCNDAVSAINPGATEVCDDDVDNDCDGDADCLDADCTASPACAVPTVSQWGIVVMSALLLVAGTLLTTQRKWRTS